MREYLLLHTLVSLRQHLILFFSRVHRYVLNDLVQGLHASLMHGLAVGYTRQPLLQLREALEECGHVVSRLFLLLTLLGLFIEVNAKRRHSFFLLYLSVYLHFDVLLLLGSGGRHELFFLGVQRVLDLVEQTHGEAQLLPLLVVHFAHGTDRLNPVLF